MLLGDLLLHAAQADAGDARRHAGEELGDQRARQADRLEIAAAAVRRQHRDAHLGHDLEQALVERLLVVGEALAERQLAEQAARVPGGDGLLGEVGVHRGGADADDDGGIVHVEAFARTDVQRREGAQRLAHQVGMHATCRQDHGQRRALGVDIGVGQHDVQAAAAHRLLGLAADALEGLAHGVEAAFRIEGAVDARGRVAHVLAHRLELGVEHDGRLQRQHLALLGTLVEDVAEVAQPRADRHDVALAQGVDRRVGHLAEILAEVVVHAAIGVRQHRERRVVAHRADGLLAVLDHGMEDHFQILDRPARRELPAAELIGLEMLGGRRVLLDQGVELDGTRRPVRVIVGVGQHVLQFAVLVERGLVHIDGQHFARPQPALLDDFGVVLRHHAGLGAGDQQVVRRAHVAQGAEPVAVEPDQRPLAGDGGDGGRAVPRLHDAVHVAVHGAVLGRHIGVRARGLGDHHRLDHRQVAMAAHQQLEDVVERRGIRRVGLDDGLEVLDRPAEAVMRQARLVALHPVDVAQKRVDLAIVCQHAEGLGEAPVREGVGRVALVEDRKARGEALIQQVGIEGRQMLGQEHALVDDRPAAKRADVELADILGDRRLLHAPAQDVELLLELAVVEPGIAAADQDLLDLGPRGVGLLADHRDVDRHLAPAQDAVAHAQDLGLDEGTAALLRAEVGARQEHHADGDAADFGDLAARIAHVLAEEILRDLDMDAGAVAGLAVGIDGAAVPHRLQRVDAGHHHVAAALAVQRHDQAHAAGIDLLGGVVAVGGGEARDTTLVVADVLLGIEMIGHGEDPLPLLSPSLPPPSDGGGARRAEGEGDATGVGSQKVINQKTASRLRPSSLS